MAGPLALRGSLRHGGLEASTSVRSTFSLWGLGHARPGRVRAFGAALGSGDVGSAAAVIG